MLYSLLGSDDANPCPLADQIERQGCALTAERSVQNAKRREEYSLQQAKAGRIPSFRIGTCVHFDPRAASFVPSNLSRRNRGRDNVKPSSPALLIKVRRRHS